MTEIKFRIWLGGRFHYWGFMKGKGDYYFAGLPSDNSEPVTIQELLERSQQYTGYQDKNNEDIYAGDILQPCNINGSHVIAEVAWSNGAFDVVSLGRCRENEYLSEQNTDDIEIIGDIYENPELLGGK